MIILTGGAGFIGSNLLRALNRLGRSDVLVVDDLTRGEKHRNLNSLDFADYCDKRELEARLPRLFEQGVEAILHQGACADTMQGDGRYLLENNFRLSTVLLEQAQERRIPFIYASSAAVYGDGAQGFAEERRCEYPLNAYAYSKFLFDQYVRRRLAGTASLVVGLRYFNVFGAQENHKGRMASVVWQFNRQIAAERTLRLFEGSAGFRRDFIYIDDVVRVVLHFLAEQARPALSGIYNVGSGRAESFQRIAEVMAARHPGSTISTVPFPEELRGKYQAFTCADLTRLRAAGYSEPFTALEAGVNAYVDVLQASGGWYR
jgi:ADP-L-glycero-D-manno-heptose 6-epimerase